MVVLDQQRAMTRCNVPSRRTSRGLPELLGSAHRDPVAIHKPKKKASENLVRMWAWKYHPLAGFRGHGVRILEEAARRDVFRLQSANEAGQTGADPVHKGPRRRAVYVRPLRHCSCAHNQDRWEQSRLWFWKALQLKEVQFFQGGPYEEWKDETRLDVRRGAWTEIDGAQESARRENSQEIETIWRSHAAESI
jgi:hypothetical protein